MIRWRDPRRGSTIEYMAEQIRVPDIVGMAFHDARDLAAERELALASEDPDGPPISVLAWPGLFFITAQSPPPGSLLGRWESIRVTIVKDGDGRAGVPSPVVPPQSSLSAKVALDENGGGHEA